MENIIEMDGEGLIEAVEIIPDVSGTAVATATGRSPEVIAAEINVIKAQTAAIIQTLGGQVVSGVYEIGRLLCEAKETVPRGEWGAWLETNVAYSDSTAQNFMRIYRELSDGQVDMLTGKTQAELFAGLDYSRMVEVFKLPKAERARLAEENDLAGMSAREVKALVKEKRALEEKLEAQDDEIVELIGAKGRAEIEAIEAKGKVEAAEKAGERLQANIQALEEALKKAESDKEKAVKAAEKAGKAQLKELQKELDEAGKLLQANGGAIDSANISDAAKEGYEEALKKEAERIRAEVVAELEKKHEQELEQVRLEGMETVKDVRAEAEAEAEKRIAEMKQKLIAASDDTVKVVSVLIEQVSELLTKITERVESAPDEVKAKLSGAVAKLLTAAAESFASEERKEKR